MSIAIPETKLFVNGDWLEGGAAEGLDVVNPATEEHVATASAATVEDTRAAIDAARTAFDEGPWPRMGWRERGDILHRMGEIMESRIDEIVALNIAEAGSVGWQADAIHVRFPLIYWMDLVDRLLPTFATSEPLNPHGHFGNLTQGVNLREPVGVCSLITAYNFPFELNLLKVAPCLASGSTAILKSSPTTPLEALVIAEAAAEAGLPPGVLNVINGGTEVGTEMTTSAKVDLVSFTGSDTVGKIIAAQAAPTLKRVLLELGGKSANVVCEDADIDKAVGDIVFNWTIQAGQGCSLATRALVHEAIYDEVLEKVKGALSGIKLGEGTDPTVGMGPLIHAAQRDKVEGLIQKGVDEGGTIALGGGRPAGIEKGFFIEPTIFTGVDPDSTIADTEFFGPVGILAKFGSDEEAVRLANHSKFGLGGGVWSRDTNRAFALAKQFRSGFIALNGGGGFNMDATFGGYRHSGLGRERGLPGLAEYYEYKSVTWPVG